MKKIETIKEKKDFNNIIKNGKILKTPYFILYYIYNKESETKFGIAAGKKLGNAVTRNKLKRQYRNIIDNNKILFKKNTNYIIMIKKESLNETFSKINETMKTLLEKVNNEK